MPEGHQIERYYPVDYAPHVVGQENGIRSSALGKAIWQTLTLPYRFRFGSPTWDVSPFGAGRMLDVGCGSGELLARMSSRGWKCWGIDFSTAAVQRAKERAPAAVVTCATIENAAFNNNFDLITVSHLIEHLPNPVAALQKLASLLASGGRLMIALPNRGSLEARLFGSRWLGWEIPRHLTHFDEAGIVRLLNSVGLAVKSRRPLLAPPSISESLILCLPESARRAVLRSRLRRYLYLALYPVATVSYAFGNRAVLEVISEKNGK
jgi:SAM-dependent methyltransferase